MLFAWAFKPGLAETRGRGRETPPGFDHQAGFSPGTGPPEGWGQGFGFKGRATHGGVAVKMNNTTRSGAAGRGKIQPGQNQESRRAGGGRTPASAGRC